MTRPQYASDNTGRHATDAPASMHYDYSDQIHTGPLSACVECRTYDATAYPTSRHARVNWPTEDHDTDWTELEPVTSRSHIVAWLSAAVAVLAPAVTGLGIFLAFAGPTATGPTPFEVFKTSVMTANPAVRMDASNPTLDYRVLEAFLRSTCGDPAKMDALAASYAFTRTEAKPAILDAIHTYCAAVQ